MRRRSRARAPKQRRTPISRVRSMMPMVTALTRPSMLMATMSSPMPCTITSIDWAWARPLARSAYMTWERLG